MVLVERSPALRASQQPGKPKPPGNPPNRREPDETPPVEELASPIPTPAPDEEPRPMQTGGRAVSSRP
jgi:hypothetical protein